MKTSKHALDLTQGAIGKMLFLFFIPIAAGNLFQQLYNTADALIIARFVGREALAAVGGSPSQVINVLLGFFIALSGGAGVVIAQAYGSGDAKRIEHAANTAILLSIVLGAAAMVIGYFVTPWVLRMMKTPEDTLEGAITYLRIYFCGMIFNMLYNMGSGILRAVGDSKRPLYVLVVCCIANIVLDVVFVALLGMGVAGVALATILSQFISAVIVMYFLCSTRDSYRVNLRKLRFNSGALRRTMQIGVPSALQSSMYNVSNLIIQVALNPLGTVVVASWSMSGKIDGVYWAISSALGTAIMSFVGQNYGAKKSDRIRKSARLGMIISLAVTAVLSAAILLFGQFGIHLLIDDADVQECTWLILTYFVPYYLLWTVIEVLSGVLRGMGDTLVPVIITAVGICVFRLAWIAAIFPHFHTLKGLSMCYPASWVVTAAAMLVYYFGKRKKMTAEPETAKN